MSNKIQSQPNFQLISQFVEQNFTVYKATSLYTGCLLPFIKKHESLCKEYHVPVEYIYEPKALIKAKLVQLLIPFYLYGDLLKALLRDMPEAYTTIFERIVWFGEVSDTTIEADYQVEAVYKMGYQNTANQEVPPFFQFFEDNAHNKSGYWNQPKDQSCYYHSYYFSEPIRILFKKILPEPEIFQLKIGSNLPDAVMKYESRELIFNELPYITAYIEQDKLALSKGGTIMPASIGKMQKFCNTQEFYRHEADKMFHTLRTRFLCELCFVARKSRQIIQPIYQPCGLSERFI